MSLSGDWMLNQLEPDFQRRVRIMLDYIRGFGIPLVVISGRRSALEQSALIRQGRTTATRSRHLTGQAVDLQWQGFRVAQVPQAWWQWFGLVAEAVGLRWGGRFRSPDLNHFDVG
jgi:peptidoglycan L-alanyl-D-glutamate endopeptidase CwlK